ncbi:MAG: hypothetical protein QXW01_03500 [Candidatus Aenigmatarchaeota archaeon]
MPNEWLNGKYVGARDYGMNSFLNDLYIGGRILKIDRIKSPSFMFMILEGFREDITDRYAAGIYAYLNDAAIRYFRASAHLETRNVWGSSLYGKGGTNVAFCDGHVEYITDSTMRGTMFGTKNYYLYWDARVTY